MRNLVTRVILVFCLAVLPLRVLAFATVSQRYHEAVLVLPLHSGLGLAASEEGIGVGVQVVLENLLASQGSLEETWAENAYPRLFTSGAEFHQWIIDAQAATPSPRRVDARYIAGGTVSREGDQFVATLVVQDRRTGKEFRNRVPLDFPALIQLRQGFLALLRSAGIPSLAGDATALWNEEMTAECLSMIGAGVSETADVLWSDDAEVKVPQPLIAAGAACPKSYVAQATLAWQQTQADAEGNGAEAGFAAKKLNPAGVRASEWLLEAAFGTLQPDTAKKAADSVMSIRGALSTFDKARYNFWTGRIAFIRGDLDEAEGLLRESVKLNPDYLDPHLELAKVANRRNHLLAEGNQVLTAALKKFRDAEDQKRLHAAEEQMAKVVSLADIAFLKGLELESQGKWEEAGKIYRIAAKLHRENDVADTAVDLISLAELEEAHDLTEEAQKDRTEAQTLIEALPGQRPIANALAYRAMHILQMGNFAKASSAMNEVLQRCDKAGDARCQWDVLNYAGLAYTNKGFIDQGVDYLEQALQAQLPLKNQKIEGITRNNLGIAYRAAGRLPDALESLNKAYDLRVKTEDNDGLRRTVQVRSVVYGDLGKYDLAIKESRRALEMAKALGDKHGELTARYTLGSCLTNQGLSDRRKLPEAITVLEQAVALSREIEERHEEGIALNNLATAKLYNGDDARGLMDQSLEIARGEGNWQDQLIRLSNFGSDLFARGHSVEAQAYLRNALAIATGIGDEVSEARILSRLMVASTDRPRLAVWYGKQAATLLGRLGPNLYLGSETGGNTFGDFFDRLAGLLVDRGSLAEAEQVLNVHRQAEQARTGTTGPVVKTISILTPGEESAWKEYKQLSANWFSLEKSAANPASENASDVAKKRVSVAQKKMDDYLAKVEDDSRGNTVARVNQDMAPAAMANLAGKAVIHTVPGDRYRVILTTERGRTLIDGNIEMSVLNRKIFEFRRALLDPHSDPIPLAQELYRAIFLPIKQTVDEAGATSLFWSVDGALRYLPVAALHDGDHYLVARYRNAAYNSLARPGLRTSGAEKSILAVGVSGGYQTLRPLPYVEGELRAIVKTKDSPSGVLPGEKRMNADFTWEDLQSRVRDHYALVHIATHFRFRPENPRGSELLFGDGPVRLDRIKAAEGLFKGVELVVLSGCETGSPGGGDSAEVDALSGAVLTLGAQRVVASLWQVADRSTSQLMANFYRAYRERGDAAEALQTAQTAMLRGAAAARHPYYWAPFFLTAAN